MNNKGDGGALKNNNSWTLVENTAFIGNYNSVGGGAIRTQGGGLVEIKDSYFRGNMAYNGSNSGNGGALYNTAAMTVSGSEFTDNIGYYGGAFYVCDKPTAIVDSTFTDNMANAGGALFLSNWLFVVADDNNVLFSGNKSGVTISGTDGDYTASGGQYNDVHINANVPMILNASTGHFITFDGSITSGNVGSEISTGYTGTRYSGTLDMNYRVLNSDLSGYDTVNINQTGGEYRFNSNVSVGKLLIYNGSNLIFGTKHQSDNSDTWGSLSLATSLTNDENGGTMSFNNSHIDSNTLGAVTLKSDLTLNIDVDLTSSVADSFSAGSFVSSGGTYKFIIDDINIMNGVDLGDTTLTIDVVSNELKSNVSLSSDLEMNFSASLITPIPSLNLSRV